MGLNFPCLALFYLLLITAIVLTFAKIFIAGLSCAGLSLLLSLLVIWKKPRSTHHAVIISIISLLVLVFGTVYYLEKFEPEAHEDPQGPTRY